MISRNDWIFRIVVWGGNGHRLWKEHIQKHVCYCCFLFFVFPRQHNWIPIRDMLPLRLTTRTVVFYFWELLPLWAGPVFISLDRNILVCSCNSNSCGLHGWISVGKKTYKNDMGTSASCIQVIRSRSSRIRGWGQSLKVRGSDPVRRLPEFSDIANEGNDVNFTHFAKVGRRIFSMVQMRVCKT